MKKTPPHTVADRADGTLARHAAHDPAALARVCAMLSPSEEALLLRRVAHGQRWLAAQEQAAIDA